MKKYIFLLFTILFLGFGCIPKKNNMISEVKEDGNYSIVNEQKIYNDILNDLIETRFYYRYLGKTRKDLLVKFYRKKIDSLTFNDALDSIKRQLKTDPKNRKTIFLKMNIKETSFLRDDLKRIKNSKKIDQFLKYQDLKIVTDSLGSFNNRLQPSGFDLDLANIKKLEKQKYIDISKLSIKDLIELDKNNPLKNEIGYFAFSKLYLNATKDEGLLYYFFICGPKCGESAVVLIEQNSKRWRIADTYTMFEL